MSAIRNLTLLAALCLFAASCATPTYTGGATHAPVKIHTEDPYKKAEIQEAWNIAAHLTRRKLQEVRAKTPETMTAIAYRFQTQDSGDTRTVERVLAQMDQKFHSGKTEIKVFDDEETPRVLLARYSDPEMINAFVVMGGSTIYLKRNPQEQKRVTVLVHEMSHLAAGTQDHGYFNVLDDNTYWSAETNRYQRLPSRLLLNNADTYTAFITRNTPYVQNQNHPWGVY